MYFATEAVRYFLNLGPLTVIMSSLLLYLIVFILLILNPKVVLLCMFHIFKGAIKKNAVKSDCMILLFSNIQKTGLETKCTPISKRSYIYAFTCCCFTINSHICEIRQYVSVESISCAGLI